MERESIRFPAPVARDPAPPATRVQYPRRKDNFEKMMEMLPEWRRGRPGFEHRVDPDSDWRAAHSELGNAPTRA